jgi:hypothetical protein
MSSQTFDRDPFALVAEYFLAPYRADERPRVEADAKLSSKSDSLLCVKAMVI